MMALHIVNLIASLIASAGFTYAVFSKHFCDGIMIKKCFAASAIGFIANAVQPTMNSQTWIVCSIAATILFVGVRIMQARAKHKKPVFLVF